MDGTGGRPRGQTNVLGEPIASCSHDPITGFFRDGCCNTGPSDLGMHTVCAVMTEDFLAYSKSAGMIYQRCIPEFGFPGLKLRSMVFVCGPVGTGSRSWQGTKSTPCSNKLGNPNHLPTG